MLGKNPSGTENGLESQSLLQRLSGHSYPNPGQAYDAIKPLLKSQV